MQRVVQEFGTIDILFNNAGIIRRASVVDLDESDWDRVMAVNVKGLWLCCKAVVPTMKRQGRGKIINISSGTIWMGMPLLLHYVASTGAVVAFTRALAREIAA